MNNLLRARAKIRLTKEIKTLLDRLCGYSSNNYDAHISQLISRDDRHVEVLRALVSRITLDPNP